MDNVEQSPSIAVSAQEVQPDIAVEGETTGTSATKLQDKCDKLPGETVNAEDAPNLTEQTDIEPADINGTIEDHCTDKEVVVNGVGDHEVDEVLEKPAEVSEITDLKAENHEVKNDAANENDDSSTLLAQVHVNGETLVVSNNEQELQDNVEKDDNEILPKESDSIEHDQHTNPNDRSANTEADSKVECDDSKNEVDDSSKINCDKSSGLTENITELKSDSSSNTSAKVIETANDTCSEVCKSDETEVIEETDEQEGTTNKVDTVKKEDKLTSKLLSPDEPISELGNTQEKVEQSVTVENVSNTDDKSVSAVSGKIITEPDDKSISVVSEKISAEPDETSVCVVGEKLSTEPDDESVDVVRENISTEPDDKSVSVVSEVISTEPDFTSVSERINTEPDDESVRVVSEMIRSEPDDKSVSVLTENSSTEADTFKEVTKESLETESLQGKTICLEEVKSDKSEVHEEMDVSEESVQNEVTEENKTSDSIVKFESDVIVETKRSDIVKADGTEAKVIEEAMDTDSEKDKAVDSKFSENCAVAEEKKDEKKEEKSKSLAPVSSATKTKIKTLDQVLSKISGLSTSTEVCSVTSLEKPIFPKKAKARKSCVQSQSSFRPSSLPPTITSLTFNVKELEKKGVLDVPKPSKRKAFEPVKVKTNNQTGLDPSSPKTSPVRSPTRSPVRSPAKLDSPFFKKRPKMFKGKRRKLKRSGRYRLPCEKKREKRKKESEERQLLELQNESGLSSARNSVETLQPVKAVSISLTIVPRTEKSLSVQAGTVLNKSPTQKSATGQQNALDMLTKNASLSFNAHPNSLTKKAKKSVKQSIDPSCTRTLDAYFKGSLTSPTGCHGKKVPLFGSHDSIDSNNSEARKRKKSAAVSSAGDRVVNQESAKDQYLLSPEEKRRKLEEIKVPQQMITLIPTTVSGGQPLQPIMPASISGSPNQFILAQGSKGSPQTLIQNGTHNGMPIFKILNSPPGTEGQPPQIVTIAQSPGKSLLMHHIPKTATFLQPKGVPLVFMQSVSGTSTTVSSPSILVANASPHSLSPQSMMGQPGQRSVLHSLMTQPKMQLPNGQILDVKPQGHIKHGAIPNGLYPVTPPKTPEGSDAGAMESAEVSPGGSAPPEKDVIPLCTCKISGASFQKMTTNLSYCQALDSVDGKVMGCCNKVTNSHLVRPAVKIPFLAVCETHRKRLRLHQCCPGCGHYCTQGKFYQCKKDSSNSLHYFHEQCQVVRSGKNYCPHCGEHSNQYQVELTFEETKPTMAKDSKAGRTQNKARIEMPKRGTPGPEDQPEETVVSFTLDKSKKILSTADIPIGPDRYSLVKFLSCMGQERPKKYRHLPKCLFTPAYDNDLERTIYMLADGHDPNEKYEDLEGQGALHAAATVGGLAIVHVLIQAGASPHIQDSSLKTPLMYAAENNHPDVVSYLIKAGAIVDAKADDGMTALHNAAKAGHVAIIKILLETDRVHIDIKDDGGWTPLIWAAEHQEVESVKFLLKRHADPNIRDSEENTTLHWAAFSGSVAIAELLLLAGCDLDSLNMHGDRPLHIAARQDHYECVVLFLARGADVDGRNNKNETPAECVLDQASAVYLSLRVNKQLKIFGAKHMCRPEKLLHRDLSKGRENIPIPCVNAVDDDGIPQDYLYVTDNIETTCLRINRVIGSLQSCQCKDDCSSIYCACGKNSIKCWYDKFGRLVPEFNMLEPPLIFECNRACECWTTCNNRVVQNGVMSRLQVFKTNGRGWGCKTLVDIQRGTFICEYIGEHISDSEADRREDDSYLFDLDNRDGETYCIDARRYGNVARFINHLCEPNLVPVKVFVDNQDLRFPRICLFASRDIKANEELGFDYGEKFWIIKWKQFTCTCGSEKCRYSIETIHKTLEEYRQRHEDDGELVQD